MYIYNDPQNNCVGGFFLRLPSIKNCNSILLLYKNNLCKLKCAKYCSKCFFVDKNTTN